jgi:hypothetical protein
MKAGDPKAAVATAQAAEAELKRRGATGPAELSLVQAAASYRAGNLSGASSAAQQALDRPAGDPDTKPRAWFIRGLIAADQGDGATLSRAIAALGAAKSPDLLGDRLELQGRAALLGNQPAEALGDFEQSADKRRLSLDYRGMARSLSLAGDASLRLGRSADSANFFLRAGRSALLQGDKAMALPLLKRADELAKQTGQTTIVNEVTRLRREAAAAG